MIRAIAFILTLLFVGPALAQGCGASNPNCVVPTAPIGDNSNRAASTAFVQNTFNAGLPLASGKIYIGQSNGFAAGETPSGDLTVATGGAFTLAAVNSNVGTFGSATQCTTVTVNAKGQITAASQTACTPPFSALTGVPTYLTQSGTLVASAAVNFNLANTDTAITVSLPPGFVNYRITAVIISGASAALNTATFGVFTATGGGGTAIVSAGTAITVTATATATNNNMQSTSPNNTSTQSYNAATVYFRVGTAEGSAATGTVTLILNPVS